MKFCYALLILIALSSGCRKEGKFYSPHDTLIADSSIIRVDSAATVTDSTPPPPNGFVYIGSWPGVSLDLRYRTENNFMHENLYGTYRGAYLHQDAADKLQRAIDLLHAEHPGWKFRIFDALRPRDFQRTMWEWAQKNHATKYVGDPAIGSGHNYGMSIDLSLEDSLGNEVDMGTPFDTFSPIAQPRYEARYLRSAELTRLQIENRLLLRRIMKKAGFHSLLQEWWHFNASGMRTIKAHYEIIEHPF